MVAPTEYAAIQAAALSKVDWQRTPNLPGNGNLWSSMRAIPPTDIVRNQRGDVAAGFAKPATVLSATYMVPYQMHGTIGPAAAVAQIGPNGGTLFCNTNYAYRMRDKVADTLKIEASRIHVKFYEGASNFGHSPYDDTAWRRR